MSAVDVFVNRMLDVFHAPITENIDGFLAETRKALAGWDRATLDEAADRIAKTCKFFPRPAEVIEVCEQIAASRPQPPAPERIGDWTAEALRTADTLIQSDMGRIAAAEGWITQLHDYCRQHRHLPLPGTVFSLKKQARLFEEAYAQVCAGKGGALEGSLKTLGETFAAKRVQLSQIANGEVAGRLSDLSRRMTGEHSS